MLFNFIVKSRKRVITGIIAILIIAAIGWHYYGKMRAGGRGFQMPPTPVVTAAAKLQNWQPRIEATGTLNAKEGVMLKSEVAGRVTKIDFHSGQMVKAGDPLLEINPTVLQAQLTAAQARADLTKGDYGRAIAIYKRGAVSRQDLDTAFSNMNADAAAVEEVKARLAQNIIRAPFSGRLGIRQFSLGDYINAGQALVNLQADDALYIDFNIPENNAQQVRIGDEVSFRSDASPDVTYTAKVTAVDSAVNTDTRMVAIRAETPNPAQKLLPGAFVHVTLIAGMPHPLVTIPQMAVVYDANGNYVYTVKDNHEAVKMPIKIARQSDTEVAIESSLKEGDKVITEGQLKITDGAPVMLLPPHAPHPQKKSAGK